MFSVLMTLFAAASAAACTHSDIMAHGGALKAPPGMSIEYSLCPHTVAFAVSAPTNGFVALSIVKNGQASRTPGDAVFGFANGTLQKWQVNGPTFADWLPSGVPLTNGSVKVSNGHTTLAFARRLDAGRYHISPESLTFDVYYGPSLMNNTSVVRLRILNGKPAANISTAAAPSTPPSTPPVARAPPQRSSMYRPALFTLLSFFPFIVSMS